ncbi:MAG: M1 family metallopeptidase [FCB group bacterium]|nr:M1 family metallopeptidase [FCB group bacterium]
MKRFTFLFFIILCFGFVQVKAETPFFKKFKKDYSALGADLLNSTGEIAQVKNFVYQKDVATFTFKEGTIHFLRYIDGRPTTAIFFGKGNAKIKIPSHVEKQSLLSVTKDSVVDEDFTICLIRMADDFDLKVKEKFSLKEKTLKWKNYTRLKQAQSETYFKPVIQYKYDNYFQLLRSLYERGADGYFWIDFNRYDFTYDPNRPEQVIVSYEFQRNDYIPTEAAVFQKKERAVYDDSMMSDIIYPTTAVSKKATLEMGGIDGAKIDNAQTDMKLVVNIDSLKYISTFLHFNLKIDSIYYQEKPVDYYRRRDFDFIGIILPQYRYQGDTLGLTFFYKGVNFDYALPYVEDPTPTRHSFTFIVPKGYNYLMPGMGEIQTDGKDKIRFEVNPQHPYDKFYFQGYASGYDTIPVISDIGITINFLKSHNITKRMNCYIPDQLYRSSVMNAFNFMSGHMANPMSTFEVFVFPHFYYSMPGMVEVPQVLCYTEGSLDDLGGFNIFSGYSVAMQWFGCLMKPATERESWVKDATSQYLSMLFIQNSGDGNAYFANLLNHRDSLYTLREDDRDRPLATGERVSSVIKGNKGIWMLHMLRFMMFDLENQSDAKFYQFLYKLSQLTNLKKFTNADIEKLAEKYYGQPLDWFFNEWLYDFGYPEYNVKYKISKEAKGFYINAQVTTKGVSSDFQMPVIMRVEDKKGQSVFVRQDVKGLKDNFKLGPFPTKPKDFVFNELFSVLSKDKVKKK